MNELPNKTTCVIIDDEEPARTLIRTYLQEFPQVEILAECSDGFCGIKAINEHKPRFVFLDIQMPRLTGFEVLELLEYRPIIIFTTAYDQYAIKAFEQNALDYLLKPFSADRFATAVNKVLERRADSENMIDYEQVHLVTGVDKEYIKRIAVRTGNRIHVIPVEKIECLEADGGYTKIYTAKDSFLKEKPLRHYEEWLNPSVFARIHRSSMVNVDEILRLDYYDKDSYSVVLKSGKTLKASIPGYRQLKKMLNL